MDFEKNKSETPEKETIKAAALRFKGEIYTGPAHLKIVSELEEKFPEEDVWRTADIGFVTTTGRFVGREEAAEIADGANQLKKQSTNLHTDNIDLD